MKLKVTGSSRTDLVPLGAEISLSNNGFTIRLLDVANVDYFAEVESPEVKFDADDYETTIKLRGFVHRRGSDGYERISLELE